MCSRLVEALNYRCLRYVRRPLGPFHLLVGSNASGKTTLLDVIHFLGDLVAKGLDAAIMQRVYRFQELVWAQAGDAFELAVEAHVPPDRRPDLNDQAYDGFRYEIAIGLDEKGVPVILKETGLLKTLAREFVWGGAFPEPVALIDHTNSGDKDANVPEVLHYVLDELGSVAGLTDGGDPNAQPAIPAKLVERYDYDPYGRTYIEDPNGVRSAAPRPDAANLRRSLDPMFP